MEHIDSLLAVDLAAMEVEAEAAARKLEVDLVTEKVLGFSNLGLWSK